METVVPAPAELVVEAGDAARRDGVVRRLLGNRKGAFGLAVLVVLVVVAAAAPVLAPHPPNELHLTDQLKPPSSTYLFGTDEVGRDVLSRVMYAARPAIGAGLVTVILAAVVGALTGLVAGYRGGAFDAIVMRVWDTLLAFPAIFLAIGIVSVLGPGWINAVLAIAILNMPVFSRLVRASTLAVRSREFVAASQAIGCSEWRIMATHIFPNCLAPLVVQMAIAAPEAILVEASLSFLGLGSQPPDPSWGNMLSAAQGYLYRSGWYALFPGLAITLVVVGMNFFADGLQDALDPRRTRSA
ncbi:MAG TPA: ABC transporter permease [Chloroflexota bacterium]|nr:ABC transporter permease [Chloroflexota bacterium]